MFEWCSRPVRRISSPSFRTDVANPAATRLIASVVPRVKTTSFGARAPRKRATFARAPSYSAVAFSERKCVPRWMFAFVSS